MNENTGKQNPGAVADKTIVIGRDDIEEQLKAISEAKTVAETRRDDDFEKLLESILQEDFSEPPAYDEPKEPRILEPTPAPEKAAPAEPKRTEPSENAMRIIEEKAEEQQHKRKKRWIFVCVAAVLVLALTLVLVLVMRNSSHKQDYSAVFNAGQLAYYDGEYDKALESLREAMAIEKTDECLLLMSQCYEAKSDYDNAISILESSTSGSDVIAKRIEKLRLAKEEFEKGQFVMICGEQFEKNATAVDLSGKQLRSGRLNELSLLPELNNADLSDNQITDLGFVAELKGLVSLDLSGNYINDLSPLAQLAELRTLSLDGNADIKDFSPLYRLRNLTKLSIQGIEISESKLTELKDNLPGCIVISDEASVDIVDISLGGKTFKSNVTRLDLSGCGIVDISPLSVCTDLTELHLSENFIRDISPLMDIPNLVVLDLSENSVSDIRPLMSMTTIEHLNLAGNDISSITALSSLRSLKELVLNNNPIGGTQSLAGLNSLRILGLKNTELKDSDLLYLYSLKNLEKLSLEGNTQLTEKTVNELKSKLKNCRVSCSELKKSVILGETEFDPNAERVDASDMGLSDISAVEGFKAVKNMDLSGNVLTDITILARLQTLEILDLSDNNITDASPLFTLKGLKKLDIDRNSIPAEQLEALKAALPNCRITCDAPAAPDTKDAVPTP